MGRLIFALLALLCVGCTSPALPPTGRTIHVALAPDPTGVTGWRPEHHAQLQRALVALSATGDVWVEGEPADLRIESYDAGGRCAHPGEYAPGTGRARIDYACAPGETLAYVMVHEAMHHATYVRARWVGHVCRYPGDAPDCREGIYGDAVLNPVLPASTGDDGEPLGPPDPALREADLDLLRALGGAR